MISRTCSAKSHRACSVVLYYLRLKYRVLRRLKILFLHFRKLELMTEQKRLRFVLNRKKCYKNMERFALKKTHGQ